MYIKIPKVYKSERWPKLLPRWRRSSISTAKCSYPFQPYSKEEIKVCWKKWDDHKTITSHQDLNQEPSQHVHDALTTELRKNHSFSENNMYYLYYPYIIIYSIQNLITQLIHLFTLQTVLTQNYFIPNIQDNTCNSYLSPQSMQIK